MHLFSYLHVKPLQLIPWQCKSRLCLKHLFQRVSLLTQGHLHVKWGHSVLLQSETALPSSSVLIKDLLSLQPGAVTQASKARQVLFHNYFLISHSFPTSLVCSLLIKHTDLASSVCLNHRQLPPPYCWLQLLTHHLTEAYEASFTVAAKDGKTATASVSGRVSVLPHYLSSSPVTYYLCTEKPLGETCNYAFIGVTHSQRQLSREMGSAGQCPEMGRERSQALITPYELQAPILPGMMVLTGCFMSAQTLRMRSRERQAMAG